MDITKRKDNYLAIPGLVVELTDPREVRLVSLPQDTATGVLELRADAVIRAPRGGLVLLATSFDMIKTHLNMKNKNYIHMFYTALLLCSD